MNEQESIDNEQAFSRKLMSSFIQISAVAILVGYCLTVIGPFLGIVLWGVVISVAVFPLHTKLTKTLGGKEKFSATIITLIGLLLIWIPGWLVTSSTISTATEAATHIKSGTLQIPSPDSSVAEWPIIGERIYDAWNAGADNFEAFLSQYQDQVRQAGEWLLSSVTALFTGLLGFTASIIIAGVCLMYARSSYDTTHAICNRIAPDRGQHLTDLAISTIRSVTNGVLGVAIIQAGLAGIGFALAGIPAAGMFTVIILVAAIVQVPAILIMLPLIVWVFSFAGPVTASVFAVYSILVALSDNILKPILLGRGVDLPVLVVLLGAIGGMLKFGVIGLFLGAVILGLSYRIISNWIWPANSGASAPEDAQPAETQ